MGTTFNGKGGSVTFVGNPTMANFNIFSWTLSITIETSDATPFSPTNNFMSYTIGRSDCRGTVRGFMDLDSASAFETAIFTPAEALLTLRENSSHSFAITAIFDSFDIDVTSGQTATFSATFKQKSGTGFVRS